ncbi:hypothetical protein CNMCM7691_003824 [Aspergillus felis]|uniref:Core Histone H2A/H2B/H3 domain-containing protein n=1 Tax=Aspergillus felis TaxID=1287682 RepID=A0A8H6VE25_9EURO|nr:hypothetical protein CNMCM7691_003824 [Aspergillus felis]
MAQCPNCNAPFDDDAQPIEVAFHDTTTNPNLSHDPFWGEAFYHTGMTYQCVVAQAIQIARATFGQEPVATEIQVIADDFQWKAELNHPVIRNDKINHYQQTVGTIIPQTTFRRLIQEIVDDIHPDKSFRITRTAIDGLQEIAEQTLTNLFRTRLMIDQTFKQTLRENDEATWEEAKGQLQSTGSNGGGGGGGSDSGSSSSGGRADGQQANLPMDYDGPNGLANGEWNPTPILVEDAAAVTAECLPLWPKGRRVSSPLSLLTASQTVPADLYSTVHASATFLKQSMSTQISDLKDKINAADPENFQAVTSWFTTWQDDFNVRVDSMIQGIEEPNAEIEL